MKLEVDINVVKVFLESSFYQYVQKCCGRFCQALVTATSTTTPPPTPPPSSQFVE